MIRRYSERLEEFELLKKRLLLSFRTDDDDYIASVLTDISKTKLNFQYSQTDFIFHYINSCSYRREPSCIIIALLMNLKSKKTIAAYKLFRKLHIDNHNKNSLNENILMIAQTYINLKEQLV